ncbi:Abi family protein [Pseudomonas syringae]|uniref:Abi family protein n=2 Tax=Pseudomonas syringae TaxID=317 RepID=A0A9Q4FH60_PSESX|nr:Abi family protein [Pseudomonas syringae]MCF5468894.1 Abi family protein [Pseudomonas syringae]MCF5475278.1 Abi family protein [Pseudomonas syringae]MCF5485237.1 Abi family protein [Pseudomonas syringae]MCF5489277.1 Abi family protein [Pseudomonas syringae]MCF5492920.1 Abi family protein [Pseudomonas syringae]
MSHLPILFDKPAKTPHALLLHLRKKGLDTRGQTQKALRALQFIGHYRLLIYMRPLQDSGKQFYPAVQFDDILALYDFDRRLRLLCLDGIDRIEVAFRSLIANTLANNRACGPHFYLNAIHFRNMDEHRAFLKQVMGLRGQSLAIQHYYNNYNTPAFPPIWVVLEQMTIGQLSRLFAGLHLDHKKKIAACFGYNEGVLSSWLKSLTLLRNISAHHSRLWNTSITSDTPQFAKSIKAEFPTEADRGRLFARAVAVQALLQVIDPTADWKHRFKALMVELPVLTLEKAGLTPAALGLPTGWETRPFWN